MERGLVRGIELSASSRNFAPVSTFWCREAQRVPNMSASARALRALRLVLEQRRWTLSRSLGCPPRRATLVERRGLLVARIGRVRALEHTLDGVRREAARDPRRAQEEPARSPAFASPRGRRERATCSCHDPLSACMSSRQARASAFCPVARRERTRVRARRLLVVAEVAEHVTELEEQELARGPSLRAPSSSSRSFCTMLSLPRSQ